MAAAQVITLVLAAALIMGAKVETHAILSAGSDSSVGLSPAAEASLRATIERHLNRPYSWGASGLKTFDCSGFVWRLMADNGILIKRTTARKFYMCLPKVSEADRWKFGNVVFFSNLKHCGIVDTPETFYHAAVSVGTHRSRFDPLWRTRITGVRALPWIEHAAVAKE